MVSVPFQRTSWRAVTSIRYFSSSLLRLAHAPDLNRVRTFHVPICIVLFRCGGLRPVSSNDPRLCVGFVTLGFYGIALLALSPTGFGSPQVFYFPGTLYFLKKTFNVLQYIDSTIITISWSRNRNLMRFHPWWTEFDYILILPLILLFQIISYWFDTSKVLHVHHWIEN